MLLEKPLRLLAIGAHPDDIELGAGGLIYKLLQEHPDTHVDFLILTHGVHRRNSDSTYSSGTRHDESIAAAAILGIAEENVEVLDFPDCGLHSKGHELIRAIEEKVNGPEEPYTVVLTHSGADTHADHREAHEASISATRYFGGTVLLYPAPSTKPNEFQPKLFAKLEQDAVQRKNLALQEHVSQRDKPFMKPSRTAGLGASWIEFLRLDVPYVEPFEVFKGFI